MGVALPIAAIAGTALSTGLAAKAQSDAASAQKNQANYQAALSQNNAVIADQAAKDAVERGKIAADQQRKLTQQRLGQARARAAGRGVVVDQGSSLDLLTDIAGYGKLDELTIRNNAEREALGFRSQGANFRSQAGLSKIAGQNATTAGQLGVASSLLGGASSVAGKWYTYKYGNKEI